MNKKIVYDFWAQWCGPCKMYSPVFDRVAKANTDPNIEFIKVNIDENEELPATLLTRSVPCTVLMVDGVEKNRHVGPMTEAKLKEFCNIS